MPLQKNVHQNGHAGNDDNIGNDIGDCPIGANLRQKPW